MLIFKLGSLEYGVLPSEEAVKKLKEALIENPDFIIWGPDIEVVSVDSDSEIKIISQSYIDFIRFLSRPKQIRNYGEDLICLANYIKSEERYPKEEWSDFLKELGNRIIEEINNNKEVTNND